MKADIYQIDNSRNNLIFAFNSVGKRGIITKVVVYEPVGEETFNLAFGDYNSETNTIQDDINSDNGDGKK